MFVCALLMCVAASAFPQDASLYRELGGPDGAFPDDPPSYQDASDSDPMAEEAFFPEELELSYSDASAGRNVESILEAPEPRADKDHSGSRDVSDHGSAHLQHGFDQGSGHGHGPFNAFDLPISGHVGYGYSPNPFSPPAYNRYAYDGSGHGQNRYQAYGGYGQGYNGYPVYGGYRQGYNGYPAYGGYRQGYNGYLAYSGYGRGRFGLPRYHHGFNSGFGYPPTVNAHSHFHTSPYGRAGAYSRPSVYGRIY